MKKSILVMSLLSGTAFCLTGINIASGNPTHTHTDTPELKPISQNYIKLAAVCFLGSDNCGSVGFGKGDEDMNIDTAKQCKNEGFVSTCSSGYCLDGSCAYNKAYGKCLAENCPTNSATTCTGAVSGKNACGVDCKQCCNDTCPSGTAKNYTGAKAGLTQCGTTCYAFKACPSNTQISWHGADAGYNDNGTWCGKFCSSICTNGSTNSSCPNNYKAVISGSSECGACYTCEYNQDCFVSDNICSGGWCEARNSCGKCTSCGFPCTPQPNDTYCPQGTKYCSNGCGGLRNCCKEKNYTAQGTCCDDTNVTGCGVGTSCGKYPSCSTMQGKCDVFTGGKGWVEYVCGRGIATAYFVTWD